VAGRCLASAQKKAQQEGLIPVFIDEAGFYLLPGRVRTYAPQGETPVLRPFLTYDHLSAMSGITPSGRLYTLVRDDGRALNSGDSVRFLRHLRQQLKCKLLVVWDGSPIHRKEVKSYMANGGAKYIHLEQLPAYAPDLNPDEGVWQYLKGVELANIPCQNLFQLRRELSLAFMRLRSRPHVIRSFFAEAGLSIES
jgi:transposase